MTEYVFWALVIFAASGLAFVGGVLLAHGPAYDRGRDDERREWEMRDREKAGAGWSLRS